jgi:hypothetical protein
MCWGHCQWHVPRATSPYINSWRTIHHAETSDVRFHQTTPDVGGGQVVFQPEFQPPSYFVDQVEVVGCERDFGQLASKVPEARKTARKKAPAPTDQDEFEKAFAHVFQQPRRAGPRQAQAARPDDEEPEGGGAPEDLLERWLEELIDAGDIVGDLAAQGDVDEAAVDLLGMAADEFQQIPSASSGSASSSSGLDRQNPSASSGSASSSSGGGPQPMDAMLLPIFTAADNRFRMTGGARAGQQQPLQQ